MNALGAISFLAREAVAAVGHMIAGRVFEAYSDDCDILADAEADRDVWEPIEHTESIRSLWDIETSEGLAYAAQREARISTIVLITERHRLVNHQFRDDGYLCACGRPFTELDVWAEHVAELIDDAITTIFPAVAEQPAAAGNGRTAPDHPPGRREAVRPTNPTK